MRLALLLLAVVAALFVVGCGGETVSPAPETVEGTLPTETETTAQNGGDQGDPAAGKDVFASAGCGSCHTLADAGTSGTVGPNLDEASPDFATVQTVVTNGRGAMPPFKGQLTDEQIANVAAYVSSVAGG